MAMPVVDISFVGDKALLRKFARLDAKLQKKYARKAIRASAKRMQPKVIDAIPTKTRVKTGPLKAVLRAQPIRSGRMKGGIRIGFLYPPLQKDARALNAIEYGSAKRGIAPVGMFRKTVDANAAQEHAKIGREIGRDMEREARRV